MDSNNKSRLEPELAEPFTNWQKNPSKQTMGSLLQAAKPFMDRGIVANVGTQASPGLRSAARKLTVQAFRDYDPNTAAFSTHLTSRLQGLRRIDRRQQNVLRVPERVELDRRFLYAKETELEDRLGRPPSTSELSDYSGLSLRRIEKIRRYRQPVAEGSLLAGYERNDGNGMPAVQRSNEDYVLRAVYDDLDETNQQILEWSLGLYGNQQLSNQQIANRLRLTPSAVTQRKAAIQKQLDQMSEWL